MNVVESDGTAIIFYDLLEGGTRLTRNMCALERRPYVLIAARQFPETTDAARVVVQFAEENSIEILNIAGPRASKWPQGYSYVRDLVQRLIAPATA
jgi:Circularly permutated YpsA SLOG family